MSETRWTQEDIDWVQAAMFGTRSFGGYSEKEVDDFLDAVVAAMRTGSALPQVAGARFATTRFRRGYEPADVDAFLTALASRRPGGTALPSPFA